MKHTFAALAALIASLMLFVVPVSAHDKDASASIAVDCAESTIRITFETEADELTYMILAGDTPVVGKSTVEAAGQVIVELPILDNGEYTLVFDPENVIDKSFQEEPFKVDCPVPTPSPTPTPPPSDPPTPPPCDCVPPPHKTLPPSDTVNVTEVATGDPSPLDNPVFWAGVFLIAVAVAGFAYETRKRRS